MEEKLALVKEQSKDLENSNAELKERVEYLTSTNKEIKDELNKHHEEWDDVFIADPNTCLLYTSPSPRDQRGSRMPSSA